MEKNLQIDGMHCASCAAGIESYLSSQDGVEEAEVDYEQGEAAITVTDDADLEGIGDHLEAMGYEVETG
ncbi:MAG: heavy-metal-associated domain-containing protein [Candidatus Nanohaloarchaea archaeon]